jgi:hypothetical protein
MNTYKPNKPAYFKNTMVVFGIFAVGYLLFNSNTLTIENKIKNITSKFSFINKAEALPQAPIMKNSIKKTIRSSESIPQKSSTKLFTNEITFE